MGKYHATHARELSKFITNPNTAQLFEPMSVHTGVWCNLIRCGYFISRVGFKRYIYPCSSGVLDAMSVMIRTVQLNLHQYHARWCPDSLCHNLKVISGMFAFVIRFGRRFFYSLEFGSDSDQHRLTMRFPAEMMFWWFKTFYSASNG